MDRETDHGRKLEWEWNGAPIMTETRVPRTFRINVDRSALLSEIIIDGIRLSRCTKAVLTLLPGDASKLELQFGALSGIAEGEAEIIASLDVTDSDEPQSLGDA